jgi:hypothetical protein
VVDKEAALIWNVQRCVAHSKSAMISAAFSVHREPVYISLRLNYRCDTWAGARFATIEEISCNHNPLLVMEDESKLSAAEGFFLVFFGFWPTFSRKRVSLLQKWNVRNT